MKKFLKNIVNDHIFHRLRVLHNQNRRDSAMDLWQEMCRRACSRSADYVMANMPEALFFVDKKEDFQKSIFGDVSIDGLLAEFGVFEGDSLRLFASLTTKEIHGFDSFEGLPEAWSGHSLDQAFFAVNKLEPFPNNVILHKGWFSDSLPGFLEKHKYENFAFMHIDCDLYSSTRDILTACSSRIVPGTIILFDEYLNYPNWENHEYKAFQEFMNSRPDLDYRYTKVSAIGYTYSPGSVAVQITDGSKV